MVPGEIGHMPEYREVTGTPREVYGPYWDIVGERRREQRREHPTQAQSELGAPPFPSSFLPLPSLLIQLGKGGILLPVGVGLPFFLLGVGEGRKRKEGGRKGGVAAPSQLGLGLGGAPSLAPFPSFPLRPNKAHIPPGGFR